MILFICLLGSGIFNSCLSPDTYLHAGTRHAVDAFNAHFLSALGVSDYAGLPCVVFFRVHEQQVEDLVVVQLESNDLIHGFEELYGVFDAYIAQLSEPLPSETMAIKWLKSSARLIGLEAFRALLKKGFDYLM